MDLNHKNEEEVLKIVAENFKNLKFVNSDLRKNKDFIIKVIDLMQDSYSRIFSYIPKYFNNDKDIALKLVRLNGMILEDISMQLRGDKEVVYEAVSNFPYAASFASEKLLDDKDLALIVARRNGDAISYFSERLRTDKEIIFEAVKTNGKALLYASLELKEDKDIVLAAIKNTKEAIRSVPEKLFGNKEIALTALKQDPTAFVFFPKDLLIEMKKLSKDEKIKYLETLMLQEQLQEDLVVQDIKQKKIKI